MRKITLVLLLVVGYFPSFGKKTSPAKKQSNEMISITLRHTGCFGRCPDYSIEVNRNGVLTYTGRMFTADSGIYTKKIGAKKALEIVKLAEADQLDTCKDRYESRVQDLPGIVYTIKYKSKSKMIQNANFGPAILDELREKIDGLINIRADATGTLQHLGASWHKTTGNHK